MAEFSDTVRPGVERLSSLGPSRRPPASAQAPRDRELDHPGGAPVAVHRADAAAGASIVSASRCTPHASTSAAAAIARSAPATLGAPRGSPRSTRGQRRAPRQRWAPRRAAALDADRAAPRDSDRGAFPEAPSTPVESYRELVELDGAHSVRWAKRIESPRALEPDRLDLEMLALIAAMRHVLTSQLHRRFNRGRAATTTQRRLKRLSDAGLVERFQFHRRDGGGIPMCYVIAAGRAAGPRRSTIASLRRAPTTAPQRALRSVARRRAGARGREPAAPGPPRRPCRRLGAGARCVRRRRAVGLRGPAAGGALAADARKRATGGSRSRRRICGCRAGARRTTSCAPMHGPAERARSSASRPCARTRSSRSDASAAAPLAACDVIVELDDRLAGGRPRPAQARALRPFPRGLVAAHPPLRTPRGGACRSSCSCVVTERGRASAPDAPTPCCEPAAPTPVSTRSTGSTRAGSGSCSSPSATCMRARCAPTASLACRRTFA